MAATLQLNDWIAQQLRISAHNLAQAISATSLCRERTEFGQHIVPARGSVLASPVIANWNPEPDYFFHWTRDAAAVMRAVVDLIAMAGDTDERHRWQGCFHDMVEFNLALSQAATLKTAPTDYRSKTQSNCRRFLRRRTELDRLHGDKLLAEPRFNPDGSVDILRWSRPQLDGPALRALACLSYLAEGGTATPSLKALLQSDLDFTLRQAGRRSIGPWEEPNEFAHHYFVALAQLGALVHGRTFAGDHTAQWDLAERRLRRTLDKHWMAKPGVLAAVRSSNAGPESPASAADAEQRVDSAILLAIVDADLPGTSHNVCDQRAVATLDILAQAFTHAFPLNHALPAGHAPALGRSLADRYFGGNAWYVTTLAAAAFCFRRATGNPADVADWLARGDAWMATVQWMTPADGAMAEQVDRETKAPRSAQHLSWNYAAFISTVRLRQRALDQG